MDNQTLELDQLRTILERTLVAADQRGLISQTDEGWQYQDDGLTLHYNPVTDELRLSSSEMQQSFCWCGDKLVESDTLTSEQTAQFHDLNCWLDQAGIPLSATLAEHDVNLPTPAEGVALSQTVADLFEYYAAQGEPAFKLAADSSIDYYSIELNGINYFLSRDEATDSYNLQRDNSDLSLHNPQSVTHQDLAVWSEVRNWLASGVSAKLPSQTEPEPTYWELHQSQIAQILPVAERFLSFQESLGETWIDPGQCYSTSVAQYDIGYDPSTSQIYVQRDGVNLHQGGMITQQDVDFFQSLAQWLDQREAAQALNRSSGGSSPSSASLEPDNSDLEI